MSEAKKLAFIPDDIVRELAWHALTIALEAPVRKDGRSVSCAVAWKDILEIRETAKRGGLDVEKLVAETHRIARETRDDAVDDVAPEGDEIER